MKITDIRDARTNMSPKIKGIKSVGPPEAASDNDGSISSTPSSPRDDSRKRAHPSHSEEEKRLDRRAANRRSAFESRQRRKMLIEDLQQSVRELTKQNVDLLKGNDSLRTQLDGLLQEYNNFRLQQELTTKAININNPSNALLRNAAAIPQATAQFLLTGATQPNVNVAAAGLFGGINNLNQALVGAANVQQQSNASLNFLPDQLVSLASGTGLTNALGNVNVNVNVNDLAQLQARIRLEALGEFQRVNKLTSTQFVDS